MRGIRVRVLGSFALLYRVIMNDSQTNLGRLLKPSGVSECEEQLSIATLLVVLSRQSIVGRELARRHKLVSIRLISIPD